MRGLRKFRFPTSPGQKRFPGSRPITGRPDLQFLPKTLSARNRAGFTILETIIATSGSLLVAGAVVSLMVITGRTVNVLYGPTQARSARMIALDQIRYRLTDGKVGSCVVSDSDHRIRFNNPNLGSSITSEFYFDTATKTLFYDDDVSSGLSGQAVAEGPIEITFELESAGAIVKVTVKTEADLAYADVDEQDGESAVYLRNP